MVNTYELPNIVELHLSRVTVGSLFKAVSLVKVEMQVAIQFNYHILQNARVISNKMVHMKRHHFLA